MAGIGCRAASAEPRAYDDRVYQSIVAAVPVEVGQVVSGGFWTDGNMHGTHRAIILQIQPPLGSAAMYVKRVYVQWIKETSVERPVKIGSDPPAPQVINSTEIRVPGGAAMVTNIKFTYLKEPSTTVLVIETRATNGGGQLSFALGRPGNFTLLRNPTELDNERH